MHNIKKLTFETSKKKEVITKECVSIAERDGDGFYGSIRWKENKVFNSYQEASEYIDSIDRDYLQIAVQYLEVPEGFIKSAKLDKLRAKYEEIIKKSEDFAKEKHPKNAKTAFVTCSHCGSKLNKEHLKGVKCPVCWGDLRTQKVIEQIEKYKIQADDVTKQIMEERKRLSIKYAKKGKTKWLVKIEYHS